MISGILNETVGDNSIERHVGVISQNLEDETWK